jgi:hypothetical protein
LAASGGAGTGDGGAGGGVTQPATNVASNAASRQRKGDAMEWLLLEALVALSLAVFIVWFTMSGKRKGPPRAPQDPIDRDGADDGKGGG